MKSKTTSALTFIFITVLVDVIGLGIIIPIIPDLLMELTGEAVSNASAYGGLLLFSYAIMQFIFSPILGGLSDRFGRRPILLIALVGLGIDYIFHAFAPSITWLFVGRIIAGVCGASFTTATAYIADISEPEKRAQNFGLNLVTIDVEHYIPLWASKNQKWKLDATTGMGGIWVIPRSDVRVFGEGLNNEYHMAGYSWTGKAGLRINGLKRFFF